MESVQTKIARGAAWMTGLMAADRLLGFISTLILARLLMPADFGIVAMCTSVVAIFRIFLGFGFDIVLIQRQDRASRDHYDTVWTFRLAFSGLVAGAIFLSAEPTSLYYDQPEVVLPMQVLAASFLLRGFENIRIVDFRKHLNFRREAAFQVGQKVAGLSVSLPLAWYTQSFWALIAGMVTTNIAACVLSYTMKPYVPRLTVRERSDVFGFSAWIFLSSIAQVVRQRGSHYILGRSGPAVLGQFQIAQELTELTSQIVASINRAIFPGYSKLTDDATQFVSTYCRVIYATALIAMPVGFGIAVIAPLFVPVALGSKWLGAVAPMQVLAVYGTLRALGSNCQYILFAKDRPRLVTYINLGQASILLPLLLLTIPRYGMMGAAWTFVAVGALTLPGVFWVVSRELGIGTFRAFAEVWRPLLAAALMYGAVSWYITAFPAATVLNLLGAISTGAVTYVLALLLMLRLGPTSDSVELLLLQRLIRPLFRQPTR